MADDKESLTPEDLVRILNILPERQAKVDALIAHGTSVKPKEERVKKEDAFYCICRQSNIDRFMICCDKCDEWFHGNCIGITKEDAKMIKHFYCRTCLDANPDLSIKYKKKKVKPEHKETDEEENKKKQSEQFDMDEGKKAANFKSRSSRMCGECVACVRTVDCAQCDFCKVVKNSPKQPKMVSRQDKPQRKQHGSEKDMRKFGGPNKMRQKCRQRQCLKMSRILLRRTKEQKALQETRGIPQPRYRDMALKEKRQKKTVKMKHATSTGRKEKMKQQPHDRSRRRRRIGPDDKKGVVDLQAEREQDNAPHHCYGPGCTHAARLNSKYCSDECGIQLAVRRIQEIIPQCMKQWTREPCVADKISNESLQSVQKKKQEAQNMLMQLDRMSQELDCIVEKGNQVTAVEPESQEADMDTDTDLQIHCVTCGLLLAPRVALRHMEKCYMKNESLTTFGSVYRSAGTLFCDFYNPQQRIYCKRLRVLCSEHTKEPKVKLGSNLQRNIRGHTLLPNAVCGCPLVTTYNIFEETDMICHAPKRTCMKHYRWEKLRRAEIDLQRVQQWLKLEEAYEQERNVTHSLAQRGGVLGMLLHQTTSPDWEEEDLKDKSSPPEPEISEETEDKVSRMVSHMDDESKISEEDESGVFMKDREPVDPDMHLMDHESELTRAT